MEPIGGLICILSIFAISVLVGIFWIWMFVECLTKEPSTGNEKIIWVVVMLVLNVPGSLLYYAVRRPQRIREMGE